MNTMGRSYLVSGFFLVLLLSFHSLADVPFKHIVIDANGPANPHTKFVGDINGDGFIDVLAASTKGGALVWYEYPDWAKHVIASSGKWSTDAEVGDVDGDGDQDVIISEWYAKDRMEWYENPRPTGNPATDPWALHVIGKPRAHDIEIGDLDKDGDLDIVARIQGNAGNKIYLWRQNSPDSWTQRVIDCPKGEGFTLGDIDEDGDLDVIIGSRWYENTAQSRAGTPAPLDIINGPWTEHVYSSNWTHKATDVRMADVNKDGRPDLICTPTEGQYRTSWLEAPADPRADKWTEHIIDSPVDHTHSLGVGDVDNDGDLDVVTAEMHQSKDPDEVRVYLNQGDGLKWVKQVVSTRGSHNIRVADIGSDGDMDIIGANWSGPYQPIEMWENLSKRWVHLLDNWAYIQVDNSRSGRAFGLAMGDLTGDGYGDIASGPYFYRNPGRGMAGNWPRVDLPNNVDAMLIVDVDDDALGDIIAENLPDVYWLESADDQGSSWNATRIGNLPKTGHKNGQGYALAQIATGGKPEILLSSGKGIYYFEIPADPSGGNWPVTHITSEASEEGIGVGDIDGDGDIDIAAGTQGKHVAWCANPGDGTGNWIKHPVGTTDKTPDRIAIADVNGDERPDIIVSEETRLSDASAYWFEQPADPKNPDWPRHKLITQHTTNSMDVGDMDNDGDIDIITGEHRGTKKLAIWENDGKGNFTEHVVATGKESHLGARIADLDRDGDLEIVSIAWDDYKYLHLWRNDNR